MEHRIQSAGSRTCNPFNSPTAEGAVILAPSPSGDVVHKRTENNSKMKSRSNNGAHFTQRGLVASKCKLQAQTRAFRALSFPLSVRFALAPLSPRLVSARRAHLSRPSLSHVLSASDDTLTLPHCPTYGRWESAGDEGDRGSRRRG